MTYGRARGAIAERNVNGAAVSYLAELVRGDFSSRKNERPLIRPSCRRRVFDTTGTFSPRGEGSPRRAMESPSSVGIGRGRGGELEEAAHSASPPK